MNAYAKHRKENGFPLTWSGIKVIDDNFDTKMENINLLKIRIKDYNKSDNTYLPNMCDWHISNYKIIKNTSVDNNPKTIFIQLPF